MSDIKDETKQEIERTLVQLDHLIHKVTSDTPGIKEIRLRLFELEGLLLTNEVVRFKLRDNP